MDRIQNGPDLDRVERNTAAEAERDVENYRDEYDRPEQAGNWRTTGDLESDLKIRTTAAADPDQRS